MGYIVDNPEAADRAKVHFEEQRAQLITPGDDPQIQRVADRFALVSAAGLIAIEAGILPMQPRSVVTAVTTCFEAWKSQRGGNQSEEMLAACRHLQHFFSVHGPARFERLKRDSDEEDHLRPSADYPVRDRCRYRAEADDGAQVYYILPEAWKSEVCGIHSPQLMAKIAREAGALELGEGGQLFQITLVTAALLLLLFLKAIPLNANSTGVAQSLNFTLVCRICWRHFCN